MASIFKTADGSWRAQVRRKGAAAVSQNFPSKTEAQKWARDQEHKLDRGITVPVGLRITFDELAQTYLDRMPELGKSKRLLIMRLQQAFKGVRIAELTKQRVCQFAEEKFADEVQPATVATYLTYYAVVLRYAGAMLDAEDATAVALAHYKNARLLLRHQRIVGGEDERDRRPSEEELDKMFSWWDREAAKSPVPMTDIVKLAICTCLRQGEIVKLMDTDFASKVRTLHIRDRKDPQKKIGNNTLMPLLAGPVRILGELIDPVEILERHKRAGRFFPWQPQTISQNFYLTTRKLKIDNLHFHDLRHDGISRLFEAGYQIPEVQLISGHKSWKHLQRYTQIRPHTLHRTNGETQVAS